jgi:hypothetical protein
MSLQMHRIYFYTNVLFVWILLKLRVVSDEITWCRLYQAEYVETNKKLKPVYYNSKQKQWSKS